MASRVAWSRLTVEEFGAGHLDAPSRRRHPRRSIFIVAISADRFDLHLVEFHLADLGAHDSRHRPSRSLRRRRGCGRRSFRVDDAVENRRVDLHQHVVGRDRVLARGGQIGARGSISCAPPCPRKTGMMKLMPGPRTTSAGRNVRTTCCSDCGNDAHPRGTPRE